MKNLQALIKTYLKKVFSDLHAIILGIVVGGIIVVSGSIYLFAKKLWISLKTTIQSPTSLWVTIVLVSLVTVYIYLKAKKIHSLLNLQNSEFREFIETLDKGDIDMTKPRNTYKYHYKVGNKIVHSGITDDLERREQEHQQNWPKGHITQVGIKTTEDAAREWEEGQKKA